MRPIAALYSTFAQRAVDQIIHDVATQNQGVTFALDRAGFVSDDGETHQGLFDIALLRSVPNLTLLAPASGAELEAMLGWSVASGKPCVIRYPKASCPHELAAFSAPLESGRGVFVRESGAPVLIAFTGSLYPQADEAADHLAADGIGVDLYNLRFLKPVDEDNLLKILSAYELVVLVEEGVSSGGFGEYVSALAQRSGLRTHLVTLGAADSFPAQATRQELLAKAGMDAAGIAAATAAAFRATGRFTLLRSQAR